MPGSPGCCRPRPLDPGPPPRPRPRRGRLRLAQPLAAQRDQVLRRRTGASSTTSSRSGSRRWSRDRGSGRPRRSGASASSTGALDDYLRALLSAFRLDLAGRRVLLDCANGATYRAAPAAFERLGARSRRSAIEPDGRNINEGCGSDHPGAPGRARRGRRRRDRLRLRRRRRPRDRRRRRGRIRDGDELIALCARHLADARRARRRGGGDGDEQLRLPPGDGRRRDRGGDDPGRRPPRRGRARAPRLDAGRRAVGPHHLGGAGPTGDGIAAALLAMRALGGRRRSRRRSRCEKLPQVLENVEIADREALEGARARLGGRRARERRRSRAAAGSSSGPPAPSRWSG